MASEWMAGLKRDDFAADCGSVAMQFRCRFWIGSDTVFAADTEISSDLVSAVDTEIGSDAVFAADSGSAAMQFQLPILDRQRCSLRCRFWIGSDPVSLPIP